MFGLREAGYDNQWNSNDPLALELGSTSIEVCEGFLLFFLHIKALCQVLVAITQIERGETRRQNN